MRPLLPSILLAAAVAADLPVVGVAIAPDGAWVERRGRLAAGDGRIAGLPADIDPARAALLIDGVPAARVELAPAPPPAEDAQAERRRQLSAAIAEADAALVRAELRAGWAESVGRQPADRDARGQALPPPAAAAWDAFAQAVQAQAARARDERAAALDARAAAVAALAALPPPPAAAGGAALAVEPAAEARDVRLTYHLPRVGWRLAWRCEIAEAGGAAQARLVPLAAIDLATADDWGMAPVQLRLRRSDGGIVAAGIPIRRYGLPEAVGGLQDIRVAAAPADGAADGLPPLDADQAAELGASGAFMAIGAGGGASGRFGQRSGGGRKRAIGRFGGSRESEGAVEAANRGLREAQHADGSFGAEPYRVQTTALALLACLGAGYDHRTPNKHRDMLARAVAWLRGADAAAADLPSLALAAQALAEAAGMSGDPDLTAPAQRLIEALAARIARGELGAVVAASAPFHGADAAVQAALAARSAAAAGLRVAKDEIIAAAATAVLRAGDRDERLVAEACIRGSTAALPPGLVEHAIARAEQHLASGRPERVQFMSMAAFQAGGDAWTRWNGAMRDRLAAIANGPGSPHPAGAWAGRLVVVLALEMYYRYAAADGEPSAGTRSDDDPARGWPADYRIPAGQRLHPGRVQTVELPAIALAGACERHGLPALDDAVWRRFAATAPEVLPAAACAVVVDGTPVGTWTLPFTRPGERLAIPSGLDHRLRLERTVNVASDDRFLIGRTADVQVEIRLHGPPGWSGTVAVAEPLPRSSAGRIRYLEPALGGDAAAERLRRDPWARADLALGGTMRVRWTLSYGTDQTPILEMIP